MERMGWNESNGERNITLKRRLDFDHRAHHVA